MSLKRRSLLCLSFQCQTKRNMIGLACQCGWEGSTDRARFKSAVVHQPVNSPHSAPAGLRHHLASLVRLQDRCIRPPRYVALVQITFEF